MSRKITVRNPDHPVNKRNAVGHATKKFARKLSNAQLDDFITKNTTSPDLAALLAEPRSVKISWLVEVARQQFTDEWNATVREHKQAEARKAELAELATEQAAAAKCRADKCRAMRRQLESEAMLCRLAEARQRRATRRRCVLALCAVVGFLVLVVVVL